MGPNSFLLLRYALDALEGNQKNANAWLLVANVRLDLGDIYAGIAAMKQAADLVPANAAISYHLASIIEQHDSPANAIEHYLRCVRLEPQNANYVHALSQCLVLCGDVEQAKYYARIACSLNPLSAPYAEFLATILHDYDTIAAVVRLRSAKM
jgi:tetratricopeptide (TPR) repeat protein